MTELLTVLRQIAINNCKKDITSDWLAEDSCGTAIFSYDSSFDTLWGIDKEGEGLAGIAEKIYAKKGELTVVVVWDKIPSGNTGAVNASRYLTPIDWAIALSLTITQKAEKQKIDLPRVRFLILDLGSRMVPGAEAMQLISYVQSEMPWIRLYRHDVKGDAWYTSFVNEIISKTTEVHFLKGAKHRSEVIGRLWQTALTKTSMTDDHHALANLVGPLLLPSGITPSQEVSALQELLKSVGLYPAEPLSEITKDEKSKWKNLISRIKSNKIKILLLDDQWEDGWGDVICSLLGGDFTQPDKSKKSYDGFTQISNKSDAIKVKASSRPEWIINYLESRITDNRFKFLLDDDMNMSSEMEVLCLDLRLFSGSNIYREAKFIADLLKIAEQQNRTSVQKWKSFDDIDNISLWVDHVINGKLDNNSARHHPHYFNAITLLPRIISNIDQSYPVIIFSSTGRRDIVKNFNGFENILTDFEKPRLTNHYIADKSIIESGAKLRNSINNAVNIIETRTFLNSLASVKINKAASKSFKGLHAHVELYIDEHHPDRLSDEDVKRNNIWIGGCIAIFTGVDKADAIRKADEFDDALVTNGYCYFSRGQYLPPVPNEVKEKRDPAISELSSSINGISGPSIIEPVRIMYNANNNKIIDNIGDYAYRTSIKTLIEYFIFEMLPLIETRYGTDKISYSIFAGTRVAAHSDEIFVRNIAYRNGLLVQKDNKSDKKFIIESLTSSTLFTISDDLLNNRASKYDCERIVGVRMIYDVDHGSPSYKKDSGSLYCRECKVSFYDNKLKGKRIAPDGLEYARVKSVDEDATSNKIGYVYLLDQERMIEHNSILGSSGENIKLETVFLNSFNIQKGDYLLVETKKDASEGYTISDVKDKVRYKDLPNPMIIWSQSIACPICGSDKEVRPDYRGGLYIADHLVDVDDYSTGKYCDIIKTSEIGFDESLDKQLTDILHDAGCMIDENHMVAGAVIIYKVLNVKRRYKDSNIITTVLDRVYPLLLTLSPRGFHELVKELFKSGYCDGNYNRQIGRQQITIISKQGSNVVCKDNNGNDVKIPVNEYSSTPSDVRAQMTPQAVLWATLFKTGDATIARQVSLNENLEAENSEMGVKENEEEKMSLAEMIAVAASKSNSTNRR